MLVDTVSAALDAITATLIDAGVAATRDPSAFQPPGVIVAAPTLRDATMGGVLELEVPIFCVTPDPGQAGLDELLLMVGQVRDLFGSVAAEPTIWSSPLNPAGLPAYRVPLSATAQVTVVDDDPTEQE